MNFIKHLPKGPYEWGITAIITIWFVAIFTN